MTKFSVVSVVTKFDEHTGPGEAHICCYMYDIQKNELVPTQTAQWGVHAPSRTKESSGSASACGLSLATDGFKKRRRCNFPLVRNSLNSFVAVSQLRAGAQ